MIRFPEPGACTTMSRSKHDLYCSVVAAFSGSLLVFAACAKLFDFLSSASEFPQVSGHQLPHWLFAFIIASQGSLSAMLLFGMRLRLTMALAGVMYFMFAIFDTYYWASGNSSCGCFGRIEIHPGISAAVSLLLSLFLYVAHRIKSSDIIIYRPRSTRRRMCATFVALCISLSFLSVYAREFYKAQAERLGIPSSNSVIYQNLPKEIKRGDWLVVCYRFDCSHCKQNMPNWIEVALADAGSEPWKWAFVSVDPPDKKLLFPDLYTGDITYLHIFSPELMTPYCFHFQDGIAIKAYPSPEAARASLVKSKRSRERPD